MSGDWKSKFIRSEIKVVSVWSLRTKAPIVSLSKKLYPDCLVLVGSRNGFKRDNRTKID